MAKLVCETCGEVLIEDLSQSDAHQASEQIDVEDHRHDSDDPESDEDEQGDGAGAGGLDDRTDVEENEDELEDEFEDKMDEVTDDEGVEDTTDDVEDYAEAADGAGKDDEDMDIEALVGSGNTIPGPRWEQCEDDAGPVADIFIDKLRQMRQSRLMRGQRSGAFDSSRMIQASRGDPRVFEREEEGDEVEYETYFVLDRSYSMKDSEMVPAENATATLMLALEEAGVKTELVDFYGNTPRVIKTKSQDVEEENGNILRGGSHATGGTPLGEVMELMSERLEGIDGQPFVVVVTDGKPSDTDRYTNALDSLEDENVPVLGVTIGNASDIDQSEADSLFDHHVTVKENHKLNVKLEELARGVMF